MAALAHGTPCGARGAHCAPRRLSAKRAAASRANVPRAPARWVAVRATEDGPSPTETSSSARDVSEAGGALDAEPPAAGSSRRLFSVGIFAPLGAAYDAVGQLDTLARTERRRPLPRHHPAVHCVARLAPVGIGARTARTPLLVSLLG